ncbi:MAG: HAD family hydrolase [Candidatus Kryptoniota bacterium]
MKHEHTVIVFDLGNVLLSFDYRIIIEKLEKVEANLGKTFAAFYKANYEIHRKFERGEYSSDEFTQILLNVLGHKVGEEKFYEIYSKIFSVNEELVAVLPALKRKYKLVLMSNTNAIHQKYGWGGYKFLKSFDRLILSHEVGAVKPEKKIYKAVEAFTGKPAREHFYVDDIAEYISAARKLGWDAVQFVGNEKLFEEFKRLEISYD